jgi:hypothetical protein
MSRFVSVTWSEGVTDPESEILTKAIDQVLKWLYLRHPEALLDPPIRVRVFGNWVIPALVPHHPYWGTQWYIDSSYNQELQRLIAPVFLELVRQEPWQRLDPHFDLALVDQDLTDFPLPLARLHSDHHSLGTSLPGTAAVMSLYRLRALADESLRDLTLARLARHHLGHVLGVPQLTRKEQVSRLGLEMHCTNVCTMRHAATIEELAELAREESEMGWPFCEACTRTLHSVIVRYAQNWS